MATAQPSTSEDLASQEARRRQLLRERQSGLSETGEPVMYGPTPADVDSGVRNVPFAARAALKLHDRGLARVDGIPSRYRERDSDAVNRTIGRQGKEQQRESLLRQDRNRDSQKKKGGGGLSIKDAISLAKGGTPTGMALKAATGGAGTGPGGAPRSAEELKQMIGRGLIKMSWSNLWMTLGHSIYLIAILFFLGATSKHLRRYIPEVGTEWMQPEILNKTPKHVLVPIKMGEIVGIVFVLILVIFIDLLLLASFGFTIGMIMDAGRALDSVPLI